MNKFYDKLFFGFTRSEKFGIIALFVLILILYFLPEYLIKKEDYSKEIRKFRNEISTFDSLKRSLYDIENEPFKNAEVNFAPFYFDPNTVAAKDMKKFGLSNRFISMFEKFRNAGAKFYKKEDLKRVYGLTDKDYAKIYPYLILNDKPIQTRNDYQIKERLLPKPLVIELNACDSADLLTIKGIGPATASKIIRYGKGLGGYRNINQLYEIYGIKKEIIERVADAINVDTTKISFIYVNSADYVKLNSHPYLTSKEASAIINYRRQHGHFNGPVDFKKILSIKSETTDKIIHYLSFD